MMAIEREEVRGRWLSEDHPTGTWRLIYLLRRPISINGGLAQAELASGWCIGEILASHEGRLKGSTSFARRIKLAGRAWIGMRDQSYLVR
jgi:hypothetical protein